MAVYHARLGASATDNTALLAAIQNAASNGDTILLPAAGTYPLLIIDQGAGLYNAFMATKNLTIRGAGSLPTSCILIPEIDATTDAVALNSAFPYLLHMGDTTDVTFQNFTIDCLWMMSNNRNAVGGYAATRGNKVITDVMVRNSRLSMCSHVGSTLAVTRFVGENIGTNYPAILGGNHGFDCDGHTGSSTATTGTITDSLFTNYIGDAIKFENTNTVTVTRSKFRGRVVMGQNDAASAMAFGLITFKDCDFYSLVGLGDDVAGAAHSAGACVTFTSNRFHEDAAVLISGNNQTETAKYCDGGANELVATGNHFMGRNSIVEYVGTAIPATAGGVTFREATFAATNYGVRAVCTKFVRPAPVPAGYNLAVGSVAPYITTESANTVLANIEAAVNAGDDVYVMPGTYYASNAGQMNVTLTKAVRWIFAPGVVFDGQNSAIGRLFSIAPTTGTLSLLGKLKVKDVLTTGGFGGVIDANVSAGATVFIDDLEVDHVERASGSALYGAAVRTRGAGAFAFNRMAVKNSKSGDTNNGGDGAFFAFEHTAGGITGGVLEMVDNVDRGTDARNGLVSFKVGANTFNIDALLALRNTRPSTAAGKALVYNNSTSGGTIRHLTSSGNTGFASGVGCINNGAASGNIDVKDYIIAADSQGNLRAGTATITFTNGIYEISAPSETGVTNGGNLVTTTTPLLPSGVPASSSSVAFNRDLTVSGMAWWGGNARPRSAGAVFRDRGIHLGAIQ